MFVYTIIENDSFISINLIKEWNWYREWFHYGIHSIWGGESLWEGGGFNFMVINDFKFKLMTHNLLKD